MGAAYSDGEESPAGSFDGDVSFPVNNLNLGSVLIIIYCKIIVLYLICVCDILPVSSYILVIFKIIFKICSNKSRDRLRLNLDPSNNQYSARFSGQLRSIFFLNICLFFELLLRFFAP